MMHEPMTTQAVCAAVGGELRGPGDLLIDSLEEVSHARGGQLTFIGSEKYAERWRASEASAALVTRGVGVEPGEGRAVIIVDDADLAMAKVLELFAGPLAQPPEGIHATAVIDASATLGEAVRIGPGCIIGPGVELGAGCVLHGQVTVMDDATIGQGSVLYPGVVVRERCRIGKRCVIHANASIGADGFGFRPQKTDAGMRLVKIPQIGIVEIGDEVEIGAGTCIDRAKFSATVVGDGCKLDNLVQIGHNTRIGSMTVISGCTAIAGSVTIGSGVTIGGGTQVKDHVTIADGVTLPGGSQLNSDVPAGEVWAGSPAKPYSQAVREYAAIRHLPDLVKQHKRR